MIDYRLAAQTKSQYKIQPVGDPREREGSNSRSGMPNVQSELSALAKCKFSAMHHAIVSFHWLALVFMLLGF